MGFFTRQASTQQASAQGQDEAKEFFRVSRSKGGNIGAALTLNNLTAQEKSTLAAFDAVISAAANKQARPLPKDITLARDITGIIEVYAKLSQSGVWLSQYGVDAEMDNSRSNEKGAKASAEPFGMDLSHVKELVESAVFNNYAVDKLNQPQLTR